MEAIEMTDPAERQAYLSRACGSDVQLRREIESLLRAHALADGFLEPPAHADGLRRPHVAD
jgi:eukaryotic-like serine/threonine-protein kinase